MTPTNRRTAMLALTLSTAGFLAGGGALAETAELQGELARLTPLLGTWQIESEWSGGTQLRSQAIYRPILSGAFVEVLTFVREGDEEPYQRYQSVLAWDGTYQRYLTFFVPQEGPGAFSSIGFVHDGSVAITETRAAGDPGREVIETLMPAGPGQPMDVRQTVQVASHDTYRWKVWVRPTDGGDWSNVMDGPWRRTGPGRLPRATYPVDDGGFVASGRDVRSFAKEALIAAPASEIFAAWTTDEGWSK